MSAIIHYILNLGAAVFLPIIMIILGLSMKMKPKKAIIAGLTLGIAFTGMSEIINFMFGAISPAASAFVKNTGIQLNAIDAGWAPMSAIAWAWPYALLLFPICIGINIVMLILGWTNCLNVDLWNVWGKIFTATLVAAVTGSIALGLVGASIQMMLELKNADITQKQLYEFTKIPGIACTHCMTLTGVILAPINRLLDFIPGINKSNIDAAKLKEKIGVFGENSVMGFIVGALIAIFAKYDLKGILNTAVQVATALVLFPMVAKLFMQALAPIADAVGDFMKKKFKDRELYIGLDWPFLAGLSEIWVVAILIVPIELILAVIMAKTGSNTVLPLGSIINISLVVPAMIVTGGNIIRMIILCTLTTPIFLLVGTSFAGTVTNLAKATGSIQVPNGQFMSWFSFEIPGLRWGLAHGFNVIHGEFLGVVVLAVLAACFVFYMKYMKKMDEKIEA
ncbi:PTS galactitol transporter subunit IIC [Clostridium omnivorum]|uniref:PTS galactitol transporter subunit IIC n=1 Tax=Clostridium omnivorum TaxID=1604902 RepID=A0ABQ5N9C5_9CLOT|nr:PTS transporter subunit IIC [Clostridium sp. E14]GLC31823.1 PTS galactitol transporter subunit IIC [Clostridium sp. E14]